MPLPTAPPIMSPSATADSREEAFASHIHNRATATALSASSAPWPSGPSCWNQPMLMPVFQVSTSSTNGMTLTTPLSARSNPWSSHSFDAWSSTAVIAAAESPSAVSGPRNMRECAGIRRSLRRLAHGFPFAERLGVAWRDVGVLRVGADVVRDLPGARTLAAFGEVHHHGHAWHVRQTEGI